MMTVGFWGMIDDRKPNKVAVWGPMGLWYYQGVKNKDRRTKETHPYGYDPFFLFGNHETIADAHCNYSDRYPLWGEKKFRNALEKAGIQSMWGRVEPEQWDAFVKAYHGKSYECVGVVEWCNMSSGYPCWSIHFKKTKKGKAK